MNNAPSPARQNGVFNTIKSRVQGRGVVQPGAFLRMHALLVNGQSRYNFNVQKNAAGTVGIHERRLDQNDAFVGTHLGLFLMSEDPAKPGTGVLQTYPNLTVFPAESGNVTNAHLEAVWNSTLYLKVDDTVYSDGLLLANTRKVGSALQIAAGGATTATYGPVEKSEREPWDGFIEVAPIIAIDGAKKTELYIDVPAFSGQQVQFVTKTEKNYLVLVLFGFLATGASGIGLIQSLTDGNK